MPSQDANGTMHAMTVTDAINRGFNLMATAILALAGAAFSELIFIEPDSIDKVDNSILLLIGLIAVVWYVGSGQAWRRSLVPLVLSGFALLGQIIGIGIEIGDPAAIGDDFGGLVIYVLTLIFLAALYQYNRRYLASPAGVAPP